MLVNPSGDHPIPLILDLFPLLFWYIILIYIYIVIMNIHFRFLPIFKHAINILPLTGREGGVSLLIGGALLHVQGQIMFYIVQYMVGNGTTWDGKGGNGEKW
jgi:hypothetical protein